ncbi:hypothetical protein AOPFMNJM_0900 [Methylobacterium jeotgali]|uniref:Uncharacterized protein n=1 Tax=Methylobacterium jeotgali TaxID=381630 RepID=A0ABQ4SQX6_9HYPH|nr:hypothetical protein AOPFMNJM_0900 [Methylobacterium jeotgali]
MGAAGEQLRRGRRPLDIGGVQAADEAEGQLLQRADTGALRSEAAAASELGRLVAGEAGKVVGREHRLRPRHPRALDAPGRLHPQAASEDQLLEQVGGARPRIGRPQQAALGAEDRQHAAVRLHAEGPGQSPERSGDGHVVELDPPLRLAVLEARLDAVDAVAADADLVVLVDRPAEPEAHRGDGAVEGPVLPSRLELVLRRIEAGAPLRGGDAGDLVERVVVAEGQPDEAALEDVGRADRSALRLGGRVRLDAERRPVAVGHAAEGVGMDRDRIATGIDAGRRVAPVVDGGIAARHLARDAARRDEGRHAVVLRRDHAADGLAAVA